MRPEVHRRHNKRFSSSPASSLLLPFRPVPSLSPSGDICSWAIALASSSRVASSCAALGEAPSVPANEAEGGLHEEEEGMGAGSKEGDPDAMAGGERNGRGGRVAVGFGAGDSDVRFRRLSMML